MYLPASCGQQQQKLASRRQQQQLQLYVTILKYYLI
jgi:hypothetical protein